MLHINHYGSIKMASIKTTECPQNLWIKVRRSSALHVIHIQYTLLTNPTMHQISNIAPFCNTCAHFSYKTVQCRICNLCIMGFVEYAYYILLRGCGSPDLCHFSLILNEQYLTNPMSDVPRLSETFASWLITNHPPRHVGKTPCRFCNNSGVFYVLIKVQYLLHI